MASCACHFALRHAERGLGRRAPGSCPCFGMPRLAPPIETLLGSPLLTPGQRRVAHVLEDLLRGRVAGLGVRPRGGVDVRPVEHEGALAGLEGEPRLVLLRVESDGSDAAGGRDVLDDLRRLDGRLVERRLALGVDDLSARGGDEVVEPHDVALVLVALLEDVALARRQLLGHRDHLVPGLGRLRHEVLAVPEQLHVGVQRDAVGLVLPRHGRLRARRARRRARPACSAPLSSRSQPASANSGVQIVSMLMMSMFLSPAARRRTSSSREASALLATGVCLITYSPSDCSLHSLAALVFVPPGSSGPSKLSVTGPPLSTRRSRPRRWRSAAARERPPRRCPYASFCSSPHDAGSPPASDPTRSRAPGHQIAAPGSSVSRVCTAVV